jgi:hypothetical protein
MSGCERCGIAYADCLTEERVRVCDGCLYEVVAAQRDRLREELARSRERESEAYADGFRAARDAAVAACEEVHEYCKAMAFSPGRIVSGPGAALRCIDAIQFLREDER